MEKDTQMHMAICVGDIGKDPDHVYQIAQVFLESRYQLVLNRAPLVEYDKGRELWEFVENKAYGPLQDKAIKEQIKEQIEKWKSQFRVIRVFGVEI